MKRVYHTLFGFKISRFIVAGSVGAATQISLIYVLTDIAGLWYVVSGVGAFVCAQIVSFTLQKLWTFQNFQKQESYRQGGQYLSVGVFNLVLNTGLLYLMVDILSLHYVMAQIIASLLIALFSFFVYGRIFADSAILTP